MNEAGSDFKQREAFESVFTFLGSDHKGLPLAAIISSILLICIFFTSFRFGVQAFDAFMGIVFGKSDLLGWVEKFFAVDFVNINAKISLKGVDRGGKMC